MTIDDDTLEFKKELHIECQNISKAKYQKVCNLNVLTKESETSNGIEWRCYRCGEIKTELGQINQRIKNIEATFKKELNDLKLKTGKNFDDSKTDLFEKMVKKWK